MSKKKNTVKNNGHFITKVIFCIVVFNIVVRSDLWISLCVFIFVSLYLLQVGFLNKLLSFIKMPSLEVLIHKAQTLSQAWNLQNDQQVQDKQASVQQCVKDCSNCSLKNSHTKDMTKFVDKLDLSLLTDSYEEIWGNYPDN